MPLKSNLQPDVDVDRSRVHTPLQQWRGGQPRVAIDLDFTGTDGPLSHSQHSPISGTMEVHSSGAPESILHSSLPGNNAPEVYSSNAPEVLHGPQDFPPEIAPGGGLEANHEGLEHVIASKEDAPIETKPRFSKATKLWAGLAIGIIIIAAIIAGAVGGTVGNRKSR